ncbi:MAG: hypothetical protein ACT6S0_26820 [Roseateles sp.]|uniref:hypothetical protein n=1 Tax=Roseateles sp. TaxID=1971397 RepID=UPI0040358BAC
MNRKCDAFNCSREVDTGRFLCPSHWRMVPVAIQRSINTRFRACRANFAFLSDLAYLQACVDAIDGIARIEFGAGHAGHQARQGSYHRLLTLAKKKAAT